MTVRTAITCVGAGVIGRSWAVAFAAGGCRVAVHDAHAGMLTQARTYMLTALGALRKEGLCEDPHKVMERVAFHGALEEALAGADYVQESIGEDEQVKRELFARLDALCPAHVVLASSTSTIPASVFSSALAGKARCLVAHPINPPHLIPVVELCPSPDTSQRTVERATGILAEAGREPVLVRKEIPGFIVNRLQMALIGEALHLVGSGCCSATDLDRALRASLGLRWSLFGPFEAGHLNADTGYGDYMKKFQAPMKALIGDLKVNYDWTDELIEQIADELASAVPAGAISRRQEARDRMVMALLEFIRRKRAEAGDAPAETAM